jgi:capsular exopolysaccharide synthesis family protein
LIRARRTFVIVFGLVFALVAMGYFLHKGSTYTASARVVVEPIVNAVTSGTSGNTQTPNMQTESEIVKSVDTANVVRSTLGISTPAAALVKGVRVSVPADTNVLAVGYASSDPATAARLANAFAQAYVAQRRANAREQIQAVIDSLKGKLEGDGTTLTGLKREINHTHNAINRATLQAQVDVLNNEIASISPRIVDLQTISASIEGGRVVQLASTPSSPDGPGLPVATSLSLILGLVIGAVIAVARGLLSDKISDEDELSTHLAAPVIGHIPAIATWHPRAKEQLVTRIDPSSAASEAYRTLATNIRFIRSSGDLRFLVVTSALMGEGKSATATNLAVVLAEIGVQTLLVDADLRRPRAGRFLEIDEGLGLREALEGWGDIRDLILSTSIRRLSFLRSGVAPADPVALLAASRADGVFGQIASAADLIICDAPPVLPVADASLLAEKADAVLFVHDPGICPRGALHDAVAQLRTVGTPIVGGVYNNVPASEGSYGERYASSSLPPARRVARGVVPPGGQTEAHTRGGQTPGAVHRG